MRTPRVAILAGLFVAGGLAGAGATALLTTDDSAPVDLVAGHQPMTQLGSNGGLTFTVDVYNPGQQSVTVEPVAIGGWDALDGPSEAVAATGRSWTPVSFEVIPDCTSEVTGTLDVVADGVRSELALTDVAVNRLERLPAYCGPDGIEVDPVVESITRDGDSDVVDIRIPGHGRRGLGDVTIDDVLASVPYSVEAVGLPATLPVEGSTTLRTRWAYDCSPDAGGQDGETAPYEAMFLETSDGIRIYADVAHWLYLLWTRECAGSQ